MNRLAIIDGYLSKAYTIIDILPKRVPAQYGEQYFKIERFFMSAPHFDDIVQRFSRFLLKLYCYTNIDVYEANHELWMSNPEPNELHSQLLACQPLNILCKSFDAMIVISGEDHYMTVYGADDETRRFLAELASSEGLFLWEPDEV